jgi:hypothetical protein
VRTAWSGARRSHAVNGAGAIGCPPRLDPEYYPDGLEIEPHRTKTCWPVFLTGAGSR